MPLAGVRNMLGFGDSIISDASFQEFCLLFGINVGAEETLNLEKSQRRLPESPIIGREHELIDSKLQVSVRCKDCCLITGFYYLVYLNLN